MKPTTINLEAQTNVEAQSFSMRMGREQLSKISHLLITNQYENPQRAALREIISNAYDANTVASYEDGIVRPVDIKVEKDRVNIRDYGPGLSQEEMSNLYTLIGMSTKEDDNNQIGAFGVGRLAPLALNQSFFITSYHGGQRTLYCCFLDSDHIPALSIWDQENSTEPTGLEVSVIHKDTDGVFPQSVFVDLLFLTDLSRHQVNIEVCDVLVKALRDKILNTSDGHLYVSGLPKILTERVKNHKKYTFKDEELGFTVDVYDACRYEREDIFVDLGGVLYRYNGRVFTDPNLLTARDFWIKGNYAVQVRDLNRFDSCAKNGKGVDNYFTLVIRVPPNYFTLTTSREVIASTESQLAMMKQILNRCREFLRAQHAKEVEAITFNLGTKEMSLKEAVARAHTYYNSHYGTLCREAYYSNLDRLSFLLPDGKTLSITPQFREIRPGENGQTLFRLTSDVDESTVTMRLSRCELAELDNYVLLDKNKLDKGWDQERNFGRKLSNNYKTGVYKHIPYKTLYLSLADFISYGCHIVTSTNKRLTPSQLAQKFGEEILKRPVLVVDLHPEILENIKEYIYYFGHFNGPEKKATPKKVKEVVEKKMSLEDSVLLRQLKHSVRFVRKDNQTILPPEDQKKISLDILEEKVVYWTSSAQNLRVQSLYSLPPCYLKDFALYWAEITPNLRDKIDALAGKDKCNWISYEKAIKLVRERILKELGGLVLLTVDERKFKIFMRLAEKAKEFIPKPTYDISRWKGHYIKSLKRIFPAQDVYYQDYPCINYEEHDLTGPLKKYEEYEGVYFTKGDQYPVNLYNLTGPLISPLFYLLDSSNKPNRSLLDKEAIEQEQEKVIDTYLDGLRAQGSSIRK